MEDWLKKAVEKQEESWLEEAVEKQEESWLEEAIREAMLFVKNASPEELRQALKNVGYEKYTGINPDALNLK